MKQSFILIVISFFLLNNTYSYNIKRNEDVDKQQEDIKNPKKVNFLKLVYPSAKIDYIGQVGGIDVDKDDNIVVLHRGKRTWNMEYFDKKLY